MAQPFAIPEDVRLGRPLTAAQQADVPALLQIASAQLRQKLRNIDDRIALYATDPTADLALDPVLAANAVCNAVRRFLNNPSGALNKTVMTGPYSQTEGFGERVGREFLPRGVILITADDIAPLLPPDAGFTPATIRVKPWWAQC